MPWRRNNSPSGRQPRCFAVIGVGPIAYFVAIRVHVDERDRMRARLRVRLLAGAAEGEPDGQRLPRDQQGDEDSEGLQLGQGVRSHIGHADRLEKRGST